MSASQPSRTKPARLERYVLALAITWTIVMVGLLAWNIRQAGEIAQDIDRSKTQLYVNVTALLVDEQQAMAVEVPSLGLLWVLGLAAIGLGARSLLRHARERDRAEEELSRHRAHLEEMVQERTGELTHINEQLQVEIAERKRAEEEQRTLRQALGERVKELDCLYSIAALIEKADTLEEVLQGAADLAPSGWQYPGIACARIVVRDQEFRTGNYRETAWKQSGDIVARGEPVGTLDVCYLEERPPRAEGPFLKEERQLLAAIAERVGRTAERMWAEEALHVSEARYRELFKQTQAALAKAEALYRVSRSLTGLEDLSRLLQAVVDSVAGALPADRVMLIAYDLEQRQVTHFVKGGPGANTVVAASFDELWHGLSGWVLRELKPALSPKASPDPRESPEVQRRRAETNCGTIITVPLRYQDKTLGTMTAINRPDEQDFTQQDVELMMAMASQAAIAFESARLFEQTQHDARTKAELLKEVNHRVKNNLVAILGLLLAEKHYTPERGRSFVEPAIDGLSHRIEGLLEVHQMLSESEWAPMRLSDLATRVVHAVLNAVPPGRHVVVDISPSPIEVSPRQANNLALVINELATNTVKYALEGRETACIAIRAAVDGDVICLEYRDDGPGYPEEMLRLERYNVGLYLLQTLVTHSLRGTLTLSNDGGAVATMHIKVEEKERT